MFVSLSATNFRDKISFSCGHLRSDFHKILHIRFGSNEKHILRVMVKVY